MKIKQCRFKTHIIILIATIMVFASMFLGVQTQKAAAEGEIIFSIYSMHGENASSSTGNDASGHAWLVIENGTSTDYNFYKTVILKEETFSIGTWGDKEDPQTGKKHKGAWLNLEAYKGYGTNNTASLSMTITPEQLYAISAKCLEYNDWGIIKNCSYFAAKVWNAIAPSDMQVESYSFPANYPSKLKRSIMGIEGHQINRPFAFNSFMGYVKQDTFVEVKVEELKPYSILDLEI